MRCLSVETMSLCCSELEDQPEVLLDQLEMILFSLQSWALIPVYANADVLTPDEDVIVGRCLESSHPPTHISATYNDFHFN